MDDKFTLLKKLAVLSKERPELFEAQDLIGINEMAGQYGISGDLHTGNEDDFSLLKLGEQAVAGVVAGFTALPSFAERPKNVAEDISYSLGHLTGFVGMLFPGLGTIGGAAAKGIGVLGRAAGAAGAVGWAERAVTTASAVAKFRSVPMAVADWSVAKMGSTAAAQVAKNYLTGTATKEVVKQALESGIHLGIASSVSALHQGIGAAVEGGISGAIAGGVFAGIGNVPGLNGTTTPAKILRSMAGSLAQGLPATVEGAPAAQQVYDYLLGAYFGYGSPSWKQHAAGEFLKQYSGDELPTAYMRPEFLTLKPEVQDAVKERLSSLYKMDQMGPAFREIFKNVGKLNDETLDKAFGLQRQDLQVGDFVYQHGRNKAQEVVGVDANNSNLIVRTETGTETIKNDVVVKAPMIDDGDSNLPPNKGESAVDLFNPQEDFDTATTRIYNPVMRFASHFQIKMADGTFRPMYASEATNVVGQLQKRMDFHVEQGKKDATYDGWASFKVEAEALAKAASGTVLKDADFNDIRQFFTVREQAIPVERWHFRASDERRGLSAGLVKDDVFGDTRYDVDSARSPAKEAPTFAHMIAGPDALRVVDYVEKRKGMKSRVRTIDHEFSDSDWATIFSKMDADGYIPYGGKNATPAFYFVKKIAKDGDFERMALELKSAYPTFAQDYAEGVKFFTERKLGTEAQYKDMITNSLRWWEETNGLSIGKMVGKGGFLKTLEAYNKRNQILLSNFYALDAKRIDPAKLTYVVTDDQKVNEGGKERVLTDGGITVRDDVLADILKAFGLPETGGFAKPFIYGNGDGQGMLMVKGLFNGAGPEQSAEMQRQGIGMILRDSTAKQLGLRKMYGAEQWKDGKLTFTTKEGKPTSRHDQINAEKDRLEELYDNESDGAKKQAYADEILSLQKQQEQSEHLETYSLDAKNILTSFGTYDDAQVKMNSRTRLSKQVFSTLVNEQTDPQVRSDLMRLVKANVAGDEHVNTMFDSYLDRKPEERDGRLLNEIVKNFDDLGVDRLVKGMKTDKAFREAAYRYIMLESTEGLEKGEVELGADVDVDPEAFNTKLASAMEWIKVSDGSDASVLSKMSKGLADQQMMSFFVKRFTSPKINFSGKAFMRIPDAELRSRLGDVKQTEFYLDEDWKALKVPAIDKEGNRLNTTTTLEELWSNLQTIDKRLAGDKLVPSVRARLLGAQKEIKALLNTVVLRVPMDDYSGAVALDLAGFSGRKGGGIILSWQNMNRLGGADSDGDTAFFYFGMPQSYRTLVGSEQASRVQSEYDATYPNAKRAFIRNVRLPLFDKPLGMFDPYHRVALATAVQSGRGKNMGNAVKNRMTIHALYTLANSHFKETGKPYESQVYDRFGRATGDKVIFTPRKDDGFALRAFGRAAMNESADNKTGMVSPLEMRAILLGTAFDRIELHKKGGARVFITTSSIVREGGEGAIKEIDPKLLKFAGRPDRPQKNESFEKFLERDPMAISNSIFDTSLGRLADADSKLYSINHSAGRPWRRGEVIEAARKFPQEFDVPLRDVAEQVAKLDFNDSMLNYALKDPEQMNRVYRGVAQFIRDNTPRQGEAPGSKIFGFLGRPPIPDFKNVHARLQVLQEYYHSNGLGRMNLASEEGRRDMAYDGEERGVYDDFIFKMSQVYHQQGEKVRKTDSGSPDARVKDKEFTFPASDRAKAIDEYKAFWEAKFAARRERVKLSTPEGRLRQIEEELKAVDDYLSERVMTLASVRTLKQFYDRTGLSAEEAQPILDAVANVKQYYDRMWRSRNAVTQEGEADTHSLPRILDSARKHRAEIVAAGEAVQEIHMAKGKPPVDAAAVGDYFDALMFSTLSKEPYGETTKTKFSRLGMEEIVPLKIWKAFARANSEAFDLTSKGSDIEEIRNFFSGSPLGKTAKTSDKFVTSLQFKIQNAVKVSEGGKMDSEVTRLVQQVSELANHFDAFRGDPKAFFEAVRHWTGKNQPTDLTVYELRGIRNRLTEMKNGPGIFGRLMNRYTEDGKIKFSPWHTMDFIETLADRTFVNDMRLIDKAVVKEGALQKDAPLQTTITDEGRLEKVYGDAKVPMTHFHRLRDYQNGFDSIMTQVGAIDKPFVQGAIGWVSSGIFDTRDAKDVQEEVADIAIRRLEEGGQRRFMEMVGHEQGWGSGPYRSQRVIWETYKAEADKVEARYQELKDRQFRVTVKGGNEHITGEVAVQRVMDSLRKVADYSYDKKIHLTDEWLKKNFEVVTAENGIQQVAIGKALKRAQSVLFNSLIHEHMPYDGVRAWNYEHGLLAMAEDTAPSYEVKWTSDDARNLHTGVAEEATQNVTLMKLRGRTKDALLRYTRAFQAALYRGGSSDGIGEMIAKITPNAQGYSEKQSQVMEAFADAKKLYEDVETGGKPMEEMQLFKDVRALSAYLGKPLREGDWRTRLLGMRSYSQYDMDILVADGKVNKSQYLISKARDERPFFETSKLDGYYPHIHWDSKLIEQEVMGAAKKAQTDGLNPTELNETFDRLERLYAQAMGVAHSPDALLSSANVDAVMQKSMGEKALESLGTNRVFGNVLSRDMNLFSYKREISAWDTYLDKLNKANYTAINAMLSMDTIRSFEKRRPMGTATSDWGWMMRSYVANAMGYSSVFSTEMLQSPTLRLKQMPYYWLSDYAAFKHGTIANKLATKLFRMNKLNPVERARLEARLGKAPTDEEVMQAEQTKYNSLMKQTPENLDRVGQLLKGFSQLEAKYEMATLLFSAKTGVANLFGARLNTWIYAGGKYQLEARKIDTWTRINSSWQTMEDVDKFFRETGVIENFLVTDATLTGQFKEGSGKKFFDAFVTEVVKKPKMEDMQLMEMARKHGLTDKAMRIAGYFFTKTERMARLEAAKATYLQMRDSMQPMTAVDFDNPWLVEMAKRGVQSSQFMYNAANRPMFAATNMGKVYSRFKLWAWNSVKFRRELYREAKFRGFRPDTVEFNRYQRMALADMFMVGLAAMMPHSMLDSSLPAPYSWFKELAALFFDDEQKSQREKLFFGQSTGLPGDLSFLNEVVPPIARLPKGIMQLPEAFSEIWSGNIHKLGAYSAWTLMPGGRMTRDVVRTLDNPSMAADFLTGIPLHRMAQAKKRMSEGKTDRSPKLSNILDMLRR